MIISVRQYYRSSLDVSVLKARVTSTSVLILTDMATRSHARELLLSQTLKWQQLL